MSEANLTEAQLREKFEAIDTDKNGTLSREELDAFCETLPTKPTSQEIAKIFKHMDIDGDEKISFTEFFEWWTNKKDNLLPLLYIKQSIHRSLSKAQEQMQTQKESTPQKKSSDLRDFKVSIVSGDATSQGEIDFKLCTHIQYEVLSQPILAAINQAANSPCVVLKFRVEPANQENAKAILEDLVSQGKDLFECMVPPEMSEQYLKMVDIKVSKFEKDYIILSVSSDHPLIDGIRKSYEGFLNTINFTDQSFLMEIRATSSLNVKQALEQNNFGSLAKSAAQGVNITLDVKAADTLLANIRQIVFQVVKQNIGSQSRAVKHQRAMTVLFSILTGFNLTIQTQDISELLPYKQLENVVIDKLLKKLSSELRLQEMIGSLPIFKDLIEFLEQNTLSQMSAIFIVPGIYAELSLRLDNFSLIWNKLIGDDQE